jgi:hypothetical protein
MPRAAMPRPSRATSGTGHLEKALGLSIPTSPRAQQPG